MTISRPLRSRAKKHNVVIQCVTRTTAECRGAVVGTETAVTRLDAHAFVNLIWPLLMLSFGPTWPLFRLPVQTPLLDPLPESTHGSFLGGSRPQRSPARP